MNGIWVIPVLASILIIGFFGSSQEIFAEEVYHRGSDYEKTEVLQDDGTIKGVVTIGLPEWILDNQGNYVSHLVYDDTESITFESGQISFVYDKNTCAITLFDKGRISPDSHPLIKSQSWSVHYAEVDTDEWFELEHTTLPCETSVMNNEDEYIIEGTRQNENGILKVVYKKPNEGPLESLAFYTNTDSEKTNHKFGFTSTLNQLPEYSKIEDKTYHVDVVPISPGSVTVSTIQDVSHEEIFQNRVLFGDTRQDKIIYNFDEDSELFWNIRLKDTGGSMDAYVDYKNLPGIPLGAGETTSIDPTFTFTTSDLTAEDGHINDDGNNGLCDGNSVSGKSSGAVQIRVGVYNSGATEDCVRNYIQWDITQIPDGIIVTSATVEIESYNEFGTSKVCDMKAMMSTKPSIDSAAAVFADAGDGDTYVNDSRIAYLFQPSHNSVLHRPILR